MIQIIIWAIIIVAIILTMSMFSFRIEHYRSYDPIQEERDNICYAYRDSFMDAHINVKEEVGDAFFKWCNDYKQITKYYPQYRSAEIVFTRLEKEYDIFNSF